MSFMTELRRMPIWRGCLDIINAMDTHTCHLKRFAGSEIYHCNAVLYRKERI